MDNFLSEQRRMDILSAYNRALREFGESRKFIPRQVIIKKAMSYKAPRFYVSFTVCRRIISLMNRGIDPHIIHPQRKKMYEEIFRRYKKRNQIGYSCLYEIISEEAPEFYIEELSFYREIIKSLKMKRRWR